MTDYQYARDTISKYLSLEKTGILPTDEYLQFSDFITSKERRTLVNFAYMYKDELNLNNKVIILCISYMDIYFSRVNKIDYEAKVYYLMCLDLASKVTIYNYEDFDTYKDIILKNKYTNEQLLSMENDIFNKLNHKLILPTKYNFYELYMLIIEHDVVKLNDDIKVYTELLLSSSTYDEDLMNYNPSDISLACILLSMIITDNKILVNEILQLFISSDSIDTIKFIADQILFVTKFLIEEEGWDTIFNKELEKYNINIENISIDINKNKIPSMRIKHNKFVASTINSKNINISNILSSGAYGKVYKIKYLNEDRAYKQMFCNIGSGIQDDILVELSILSFVSHANLLSLDNVIYDGNDKCFGVIFEIMDIDLNTYIQDNNIDDYKSKRFSSQLLQAVCYLHQCGIVHYDIKPKNILIKDNDIKLADYGIGRIMIHKPEEYYTGMVTITYRPPELIFAELNRIKIDKYSKAPDVWSIGAVIAFILMGETLFDGSSVTDMAYRFGRDFGTDNIKKYYKVGKNYPTWKSGKNILPDVNDLAKDLILKLLDIDPNTRLTAKQALLHPWLMS